MNKLIQIVVASIVGLLGLWAPHIHAAQIALEPESRAVAGVATNVRKAVLGPDASGSAAAGPALLKTSLVSSSLVSASGDGLLDSGRSARSTSLASNIDTARTDSTDNSDDSSHVLWAGLILIVGIALRRLRA